MKKPTHHKHAETNPTRLGPTSSSHLPAKAAANPRKTIAVENIHTTSLNDQSFAELVTTPRDVVRAGLNILHAYTDPIHKCIEIEMGGTNHLLKFSLATIFAFEKMLNFTPLHLVL